ncbi:hypothetical protein EGW08_016487, partial [Elysia chlorotica]
TYGADCSQTCNSNCGGVDKECDHITGHCLKGCVIGYKGDFCNELCEVGTYGADCSQTCNSNCGGVDKECNHITGLCLNGCVIGYKGDFCNERRY